MKIDLSVRLNKSLAHDDFVTWALINMMTNGGLFENKQCPDAKNLEVDLKINGQDMDLIAVLDEIERQMERMVEARAKKLVEDKFQDIYGAVDELERKTKALMRERLPKLNWED